MDLRTVKHFIWKSGGDLTVHYKQKPTWAPLTTVQTRYLQPASLWLPEEASQNALLFLGLMVTQEECFFSLHWLKWQSQQKDLTDSRRLKTKDWLQIDAVVTFCELQLLYLPLLHWFNFFVYLLPYLATCLVHLNMSHDDDAHECFRSQTFQRLSSRSRSKSVTLWSAPFCFFLCKQCTIFSRFNVIIIYLKLFLFHKSKLSNVEQVSKDDFNA